LILASGVAVTGGFLAMISAFMNKFSLPVDKYF